MAKKRLKTLKRKRDDALRIAAKHREFLKTDAFEFTKKHWQAEIDAYAETARKYHEKIVKKLKKRRYGYKVRY